jgi:hypothetical protein
MGVKNLILGVCSALVRAKTPILTVAIAYVLSVGTGIIMVHSGNKFALTYRDSLVSKAQTGYVLTQKSHLAQGIADFGGNLLGAVDETVIGISVILPYPLVIYRGWVGGIVSVEADHTSRLTNPTKAAYYFSVLFLQLLGYSMAAGAGINLGLSVFRSKPKNAGFFWFRIPKEALLDTLRIYTLVIPVFLIASLWEFLSPWN